MERLHPSSAWEIGVLGRDRVQLSWGSGRIVRLLPLCNTIITFRKSLG